MARMIPERPRDGANGSERRIFDAFAGATGIDDWIVMHSLRVRRHAVQFEGEADFVVFVPGRGIVVIEAKSPEYVSYRDGEWRLDRVPNPGKSPFGQIDGVVRSLRGFLGRRELLAGPEPIARLVWFTSLERHLFENGSPGDMQFFEWELAWRNDLANPAAVIRRVLDEYDGWYSQVDGAEHDPAVMTAEHVDELAAALIGDFAGGRTLADRKRERLDDEGRLLKEQRVVLDKVEDNDHLFFVGPAGTGKSYLLAQLAKRWGGEHRTLVTCWNLLMADELRDLLRQHPEIAVQDLNAVMLRITGLEGNPDDADRSWYTEELPLRAIAALQADPRIGRYDAICVDEFQDIAGFPAVLDFLLALRSAGPGKFAAAADPRQQILRSVAEQTDPFESARARIPDLVRVNLRRGLRQVSALTESAESLLLRRFGYRGHRTSSAIDGPLSVKPVADNGKATHALAAALRELLEHDQPHDIVILSPFSARRSLVGRLLEAENFDKEERWLRERLRAVAPTPEASAVGPVDATAGPAVVELAGPAPTPAGTPRGRIRSDSIFRFKGLDAEAVILTDIGDDGVAFAQRTGLSWFDILYVGLTRARYRCVIVAN